MAAACSASIPILHVSVWSSTGTSESTLQLPGGKEASSWQWLQPTAAVPSYNHWKTTAYSIGTPFCGTLLCHATWRLAPSWDILPTLLGLSTSWLVYRLLSAHTHTHIHAATSKHPNYNSTSKTHFKYKRDVLSVALCCCGNKIPRAYPGTKIFLKYWIIMLATRRGKAKIIPSKQADLHRSLIFSFSLHLAQSWTFLQHADIYQVTMQIA